MELSFGVTISKSRAAAASGSTLLDWDGRRWSRRGVGFPIAAIAPMPGSSALCVVSREGRVAILPPDGGRPSREQIPDVGTAGAQLGYLHVLHLLGGALWAAGDSGQVYRRDDGAWTHMDRGLLSKSGLASPTALRLRAVAADTAGQLYAVGHARGGVLARFDGRRWRKENLPTRRPPQGLCVTSRGVIWVCAGGGGLIRSTKTGWRDASFGEDDWWALETFEDRVFVAGDAGVFDLTGAAPKRVPQIPSTASPFGLSAADGRLLSFGLFQVHEFDGKRWSRLPTPK